MYIVALPVLQKKKGKFLWINKVMYNLYSTTLYVVVVKYLFKPILRPSPPPNSKWKMINIYQI